LKEGQVEDLKLKVEGGWEPTVDDRGHKLEGWKPGRLEWTTDWLLFSVHNDDPPFVGFDAADVLTVSE
jgi:hypothetical protein